MYSGYGKSVVVYLGTIHILRGGVSENANFLLFSLLKACLPRGEGGSKNPKNVIT